MKVLFLTNEYPPHIYGGAGVHVGYLSRELARLMLVEVRCFGDQDFEAGNLRVTGFELNTSGFTCPEKLKSAFGAVRRCTDFNTMNIDADIVHCHTWYSHFGGILAKKNYGIPLVITVHSLEPLRPSLSSSHLLTCPLIPYRLKAGTYRDLADSLPAIRILLTSRLSLGNPRLCPLLFPPHGFPSLCPSPTIMQNQSRI